MLRALVMHANWILLGKLGWGGLLSNLHAHLDSHAQATGRLDPSLAPSPSPPSLEALSLGRNLLGGFYASERIWVNCCLSQGQPRFRMQLSQWDSRLSVLKCVRIIPAALLPSLFLPPTAVYWIHGVLGCVTHWAAINKTGSLPSWSLRFGWKDRQNPSVHTRPIMK